MKAMIFAAGLGTRLMPLTANRPKALVQLAGKTLLEWSLNSIQKAGVTEVIINLHHHPQQMKDFIESLRIEGMTLSISDETSQLLDTGGGLQKAAWFFNDDRPFFLCNADILHNLDLKAMRKAHESTGSLATLAVKSRETSRYLVFDNEKKLCAWQNRKTGTEKIARDCGPDSKAYAFSGIQVIEPEIFKLIPFTGTFSMIDLYLNLAANHSISAYVNEESLVMDLGKPAELEVAEKMIRDKIISFG